MPQIILYEWKIIFSGSLLHKMPTPWLHWSRDRKKHTKFCLDGEAVRTTYIVYSLSVCQEENHRIVNLSTKYSKFSRYSEKAPTGPSSS